MNLQPHIVAGLGLALLAGLLSMAQAEDRGAWFKSLKQPGTGYSCCDIADCRRTEADWHSGQWWADVGGAWTPIPHDKELTKPSIDGDAYVCYSPTRQVYCFVKPNMAM
jgi:hypothetical protein